MHNIDSCVSIDIQPSMYENKDHSDEDFTNLLNSKLTIIRNTYNNGSGTMSPILLSNNNSDCDSSDSEYLVDDSETKSDFVKLTYLQVKQYLYKYYEETDNYGGELELLQTFVKGQKHLFLKAKHITRVKLNLFMIPSLIFSTTITIFAPVIRIYYWSGFFISALNSLNILLLSFVHYFKLQSAYELFQHIAIQYDKLENLLDNGAVFDKQNTLQKMIDVEKKMNDIRDTPVFIPEELKRVFPIICHINIFSFIKKFELYRKKMILKFRDIKNEIRYIQWKWGDTIPDKQRHRYDFLLQVGEKVKEEILHYKNAYGVIDCLFVAEIQRAENMGFLKVFFYNEKCPNYLENVTNPILKEYLNSVFDCC